MKNTYEDTNNMDISQIREEFPVLKEWTYLDNAFVGLMPRQVREGHLDYIDSWYKFKTRGGNTILQDWLEKTSLVRRMVAEFINVKSREIAFTMNTGAGLNIIINGIDWEEGDNVVFPEWEHNPLFTYKTKEKGVEHRAVPVKDGIVDISEMEKAIDDRTKLVQVSHVSYVNGFRFDLKEIAEISHGYGAKLLVDATQAVGAIQVDYERDNVDFVSVAPYKYLMGPTGLAFLYVNERNLPELIPDRTGWKNQAWEGDNPEDEADLESAEKFEYGTLNFEGMYALERSLIFLNELGIENIEERVLNLSNHLYDNVVAEGKDMYTADPPNSPIVSYYQKNAVTKSLQLKNQKIKVTGREAHGGHMRVSVHFYNTEDDIDRFIREIGQ
ncbi:aminotransferase class V-fold PLP-dependent enzyme [Candidatus Bathyarchaeota archaeon]|nr:aminotransferase class V-fold PLP-dependent enzyme [Candidatus Bathyarchaeota archaeon]